MQGLKNILSKYYGALICTAFALGLLFAAPASAENFFHDMASYVDDITNDYANKAVENCANAPDKDACERIAQMAKDLNSSIGNSAFLNKMGDILDSAVQFASDAANALVGAVKAAAGVAEAIVDMLIGACPQAAVFYQNHLGGCWSCTLFDTVFTAINSLATETYYRIAPSCAVLMMVCAMIWIGVFTIRYIGALNEQKPEEYLTKLFGLLLKCMAVGVLLVVSASTFANLILSPVIVASSDLSTAILHSFTEIREQVVDETAEATTTASCDSEKGCAVRTVECGQDGSCKITEGNSVRFTPLACEKMKEEPKMGGLLYDGDPIPENEKLLNDQIYYSLMCMVNNLHYEIAYVVALADAMICYSWTANTIWISPARYLSLKMLISGLFIFVAAILISLAYVFKLIDALFRLSILCVLLPLLAVAWVFPATVEFAKRGFSMLIHVMMMFITLSIVVSLVLMLVLVAFTSDSGDNSLMQLFNENRIYDMKDLLDFFSLNFIFGLISLFLAFKLLDIVDNVASAFSGVDVGTSAGDQLSMVLARSATNLAKGAATVAKMGATAAGHHVSTRIAQSNFGSRFHTATRNFNFKLQQALGVAPSAAAMKSTARMTSVDFDAAALAGTAQRNVMAKNIADAKEILRLEDELAKDPTSKHLQEGVKYHKDANPTAARYAANVRELAYAQKVEARAKALEMAYGYDKLNALSDVQKQQLMLDKEVKDKENLAKVTKSNYESLNNMNGGDFKALEEKADIAKKIREGTASDDEINNTSIMLSAGDKDMQNLLAMQEEDFDAHMRLIRDTRQTADIAKVEVQKEFKRVAAEQEQWLESESLARDIAASKGTDLAAVAAYDALDEKYKHGNVSRALDINEEKDRRERITNIVSDLNNKGWDVGEDTYSKDLEKTYASKLGSDFYGIVWK